MLFSVDARQGLADGSITTTVRRWSRAQVKPGGAYRVLGLRLVVHTVEQVTVTDLTPADALACGEADLTARRRRLGDGSEPAATLPVWRVTFTVAGPDDRLVLQLIADRPAVVSTELAAHLGRERQEFKRDVRKLKERGLTCSLDVGYELSPRGRSVLDAVEMVVQEAPAVRLALRKAARESTSPTPSSMS